VWPSKGDFMPHRHSPTSKHVQAKKLKFKILKEYCLLPKVWDPKTKEVISLEDSEYFLKGEVLLSPKHISPQLKE
jgi:hypothetical protein